MSFNINSSVTRLPEPFLRPPIADKPSPEQLEKRHTQYSGLNDLRLSKQLAADFKLFEDPKQPGFITFDRLEELARSETVPSEVSQFAEELLQRESLLDKLDADSNKWLDGKITEESIQASIAAQTQERADLQAKKQSPVARAPYFGPLPL